MPDRQPDALPLRAYIEQEAQQWFDNDAPIHEAAACVGEAVALYLIGRLRARATAIRKSGTEIGFTALGRMADELERELEAR